MMYNGEIWITAHGVKDQKLTNNGSLKFEKIEKLVRAHSIVSVHPKKKFQDVLGIGASFTDAAAENFHKLSPEAQNRFLEAHFCPTKGIGYSLGRTNIHSCDFSSESYTYIDDQDSELKSFNIDHDKQFRIPFIKRALAVAGDAFTLYASPWSPPAFMKTNQSMLVGGKLIPKFYSSWANYFVKFIQAYENESISIWGVSIQNEARADPPWESCQYLPNEERDFLKILGPTLHSSGLGDKKIIVWDHNRDFLFEQISAIFEDPEANKYAWGVGFHWYENFKNDGHQMFDALKRATEAYPEKKFLCTEACNEFFNPERQKEEDPKLAERYGKAMIMDFNNGAVGWTDWNILLDQHGGPNHLQNMCFAAVHLTGDEKNELLFTHIYYYIGHFSKFVRPGARRITSNTSKKALLTTAFENPDNSVAVVVMNETDKVIHYYLKLLTNLDKIATLEIPPHSIQTILLHQE